ncbi:MAG: Bax inhibitor-1/YccA family protein [Gammaproteobacteria bacterium]|nr:Bax inhibitor-1/YccA family protein [Gammaproteobacteria bacterium]MCK5263257.1 Bax inhibitor-1/YccA family protein [Gammaproteobacteria bacterium]
MQISATRSESQILSTNKVLKNTYALLSATLFFSALMAALSMAIELPHGVSMIGMFGAMGLIFFALPRTANSSKGLWVVFGITGLLGLSIGPMLNAYLQMANGGQIIATAFGGTGVIFLGLSGYALTSRKDFSFMAGFLVVGMGIAIVAMIANIFLDMPALSLAISSAVILIMSGFILHDTSAIIRGEQTNYIMATVGMYLSIFNIFIHLLNILGALSGRD